MVSFDRLPTILNFSYYACVYRAIRQRMTALKSAYADIILNTTKESATRILASERRALQLQQNLSIAKDDSLAILLRLKAIMEAKVLPLSLSVLHCLGKISRLNFISRCSMFSVMHFLSQNWLVVFLLFSLVPSLKCLLF